MAINPNRAFEVEEHGIWIDTETGLWIGGGQSVPTLSAPEGSRYFRTSPAELYVQEGPGNTNNWQLFTGSGGQNASYAFAKGNHISSPISYDLNADVWTKFEHFNGEIESSVATVDLPNNKIIIPTNGAGVYQVSFTVNALFNTAGLFHGSVYKNGVIENCSVVNGDFSNGQNDFISGHCLIDLSDNDELELYIKSSAANQDPSIETALLSAVKISGGGGPIGPQGPAGETNADGGNAFTIYPAINIDGGTA